MSRPGPRAPRRLIDEGSPAAGLLSRAERGTEPPLGARERVWRGLTAAKPARTGFAWWQVGLPAALAAVLVIALVRPGRGPAATQPIELVEVAGSARLKTPGGATAAAAVGATLQPGSTLSAAGGDAVVRLGESRAAIAAGARISLAPRGSPAAFAVEEGLIAVLAQARSRSLTVVAAGPYLVEGSAALFLLRADASAVSVRALRGAVTVRTPSGDVPVAAGGSWSSQGAAPAATEDDLRLSARAAGEPLPARSPRASAVSPGADSSPKEASAQAAPAPVVAQANAPSADAARPATAEVAPKPPTPKKPRRVLLARAPTVKEAAPPEPTAALSPAGAPAAPAAAASAETDEALHARALGHERRGELTEAAGLYAELSRRQGPRAGTALYELGRLRQRFLHQPAAALEALNEYERRFPDGSLALEAALTAIEARISLGGGEPAREAMDSFLGRFGESERAPEVRWLRASLLVERGECADAAADLSLLSLAGPRAADAVFAAASCARTTGRLTEARARLEEYLRRFPAGPRRAEVEAALAGSEGGK